VQVFCSSINSADVIILFDSYFKTKKINVVKIPIFLERIKIKIVKNRRSENKNRFKSRFFLKDKNRFERTDQR